MNDLLLQEYDALEDAIEETAADAVWRLADWLAENVPAEQGARNDLSTRADKLTLDDLADRRGRSRTWLHDLRKVAEATAPDRLDVTPSAYRVALRATGWDLKAANARLTGRGTRKRDQSGPMMSDQAIREEIAKRPPERQAELLRSTFEAAPDLVDQVFPVPQFHRPEPTPMDLGPQYERDTSQLAERSAAERFLDSVRLGVRRYDPEDYVRLWVSARDRERELALMEEAEEWFARARRALQSPRRMEVV